MKSICIKTNNSKCINYLLNELKNTSIDKVLFRFCKFKHYENVVIHYKGEDNSSFISQVSSILSFLVIDELEEIFYKRIISHEYFYFDKFERKSIFDICFDIISEDNNEFFNKKYLSLHHSFFEYLSENKSIVLEGFINFRIPEYFSILEEIVDEAVNSFVVEKEYLEFISLLKLYINSQRATCEFVHLVYFKDHSIILDKDKNIISASSDLLNAKYLSDISFSENDIALNTLLNIVPKKIFIHLINCNPDEFIKTVSLIFENKTELCTDCNICKIYMNKKKSELFYK